MRLYTVSFDFWHDLNSPKPQMGERTETRRSEACAEESGATSWGAALAFLKIFKWIYKSGGSMTHNYNYQRKTNFKK